MAKKTVPKRTPSSRRSRTRKQKRPVPQDQDILNADAAALVVGLSKETLLRLARNGELPGRKVGREWRFSRSTLRKWIAGEGESASLAQAIRGKGLDVSVKKN